MKADEALQILRWDEIRKDILAINNTIGADIDSIDGVDKFKVIKVSYTFGEDVVDKGKFKLNLNGENIFYDQNDKQIHKEIRSLLNYNWKAIPFGMVMSNSTESYIDHSSHIVPFRLMPPGTTFSVVTIFDEDKYSNTVAEFRSTKAGCRSLILLPKIAHAESNQRLERLYGINKKYLCPKKLSDHWFLFKELAFSNNFATKWKTDLIFFSKEFLSDKNNTLKLRFDLLYRIWQMDSFRRNQITYDFIWSMFLKNLPISLKHDPFIIETVKHLILIAMQEVPGYIPACDDMSAPISDLTEAFINCYKIRYYMPIFMRLDHFDGINPVYYSLHRQTFFYDLPQKPAMKQTINQLEKIIKVLNLFTNYILENKFEHPLDKTLLYKNLLNTEFDFFHPDGDNLIKNNILDIVANDQRFSHLKNNKNLAFPEHSIFFHGCIRIRGKK